MLLDQFCERNGSRKTQQFARHLANFLPEFYWTPDCVPMPEGHFPRLSGSGRYDYLLVGNFFDAPSRRAKNYGVALPALENHFFVKFTDARSFGCPCKKYSVQPAIGDRATVDDGDVLRTLPPS